MIQPVPSTGTPITIAVSAIETLTQIRTRNGLDEESLRELAASLTSQGMLQPIIVAPGSTDSTYRLVAGERRVLAASMIDMQDVPAILRTGTEAELAAMQAIENLQRENLALLDIADGLKALRSLYPRQIDLARAIGKSKGWISKHERLAKLTPAVHEAVANGLGDVETITTIDALARLKTEKAQQLLRQCLIDAENDNLTRELARKRLADAKRPKASSPQDDTSDEDQEGDNAQANIPGTETFGKLELAEQPARLILAALEFAQKQKPSTRPDDALIEHVRGFIIKTWDLRATASSKKP